MDFLDALAGRRREPRFSGAVTNHERDSRCSEQARIATDYWRRIACHVISTWRKCR